MNGHYQQPEQQRPPTHQYPPQYPQQAGWAGPPPNYPPLYGQAPQQPPKRPRRWPAVVVGIVGLLIVIGMANGGGERTTASTSSSPTAASSPSASSGSSGSSSGSSSAINETAGPYGTPLTAGGLTVTASEPESLSQTYLGTQVCSTVTYRNTGSTPEQFNPFDWKFRTSNGVESNASIPFNSDSPLRSGQLAPGGTVSGQVCGDDSVTSASAVVYSPGLGIMYELVWS